MFRSYSSLTLLLIVGLLGFSACDDDEDDVQREFTNTLAELVAGDPQFSTLLGALQQVGLDSALADPNATFTVFAPTNDAFSGVNLGDFSDEELTNILNYHLVPGRILARNEDFVEGDQQYPTANTTSAGGNAILLDVNRDGTTLDFNAGGATGSGDNIIRGVNGVIIAIDQVLIPPTIVDLATRAGNFTILLSALEQTGLDATLAEEGDYTVFAPTDSAFIASGIDLNAVSEEDLRQTLLYHVLGTGVAAGDIDEGQSFATTLSTSGPGDTNLSLFLDRTGDNVTVNGGTSVVTANQFTSNGVIHVVDSVLMMQSVFEFAVLADGLDSLVNALNSADLDDDVANDDGPLTLFAPTNEAFVAAADTIATFGMDTLVNVLVNHLVDGNTQSSALMDGMEITTRAMGTVTVSTMDGDEEREAPVLLTVDSTVVNFVETDIQATNGVIHLIDGLLLPEIE